MPDEHHTRTEAPGKPDDSRPASFGGLTEAAGLGPATPDTDFLIGRVVGGVTIVRLIAEGGMGRVYEGLQDKPRRPVAVKVMRPGFVSRDACRRFDHEAEVLGKLRHPSIAQIFSAGIYDMMGTPVPYFVMEYIPDALPITKFVTQNGLTTDQRLQLFREVCEAVAEGHKQGIVHRDLKPSNILVEPAKVAGRIGTPKIIDFGVARSIDAAPEAMTGMTDMGRLIGTLQYMSPEQFLGDPAGIDVRADVYALGVILYELLAGQPPYEIRQQQIFEAARIVREQAPKPVTSANRSVRPEVARITDTCLRKDPRQRYADASELAGAVQACLNGAPAPTSSASGPGVAPAGAAMGDRLKRAWPYLLAAAGIAGVAVFLVRRDPTRRPPPVVGETVHAPSDGPSAAAPEVPPAPASQPVASSAGGQVTSVKLDGSYEARQARLKRRDEGVPPLLVGYPQNYLTFGTENEPHRDRETGELVVPLQLSFDRAKYLAMARRLADLMKVDDDRWGEVVSDGTYWETDKEFLLTPSEEKAREDIARQQKLNSYNCGPFIPNRNDPPALRCDRIVPVHRGWHDCLAYAQTLADRRDTGVIVVILVELAEDFSRSKWEWFHLTANEYIDLFGNVRQSWTHFTKGPPTLECITSALGPQGAPLVTDTLPLQGPGLTSWRADPDIRNRFAVFAPFFVSLKTSSERMGGSPIDWYVPHWFVERRLKLPEQTPSTLRVATSIQPLNAVPNAGELQIVDNAVGMKMVRIPAGTFRKEVGAPRNVGYAGKRPDGKVIDVRIGKPFWISQTEVTNAQWRTVMGESFVPSYLSKNDRDKRLEEVRKEPRNIPVGVPSPAADLQQLRDFCDRLTALDREKRLISSRERYALPTECQWEYACMAGGGKVYPLIYETRGEQFEQLVGVYERPPGRPVGLSRPNAWGLFDMLGDSEVCENSAVSQRNADERSDDPAFKKEFHDEGLVLLGLRDRRHVGYDQPGGIGGGVGLRVVRIETDSP